MAEQHHRSVTALHLSDGVLLRSKPPHASAKCRAGKHQPRCRSVAHHWRRGQHAAYLASRKMRISVDSSAKVRLPVPSLKAMLCTSTGACTRKSCVIIFVQ